MTGAQQAGRPPEPAGRKPAGPKPAGPKAGAPKAGGAQPAGGPPAPARERPRFTSRVAVLIVVVCAIALSLAYPVREYIAQLHQIDQLRTEQAAISAKLSQLKAQRTALGSTTYIEQQARRRLHMCFPSQTCYAIVSGAKPAAVRHGSGHTAVRPWYQRLWTSVGRADRASAS